MIHEYYQSANSIENRLLIRSPNTGKAMVSQIFLRKAFIPILCFLIGINLLHKDIAVHCQVINL